MEFITKASVPTYFLMAKKSLGAIVLRHDLCKCLLFNCDNLLISNWIAICIRWLITLLKIMWCLSLFQNNTKRLLMWIFSSHRCHCDRLIWSKDATDHRPDMPAATLGSAQHPNNEECGIRDVWAHNLEDEFRTIRQVGHSYLFSPSY